MLTEPPVRIIATRRRWLRELSRGQDGEALCMGFAGFFMLTFVACQGQTVIPDSLPELNYPPIARAAHVQGDVVVSFQRTPEGTTSEVRAISGPEMLKSVAVQNVKAWHFGTTAQVELPQTVTFHFQFSPPKDGFDHDTRPMTKLEVDGAGGVRVLSVLTTGLWASECPSASESVPPTVITGDFAEVQRWNETVKVGAEGSVAWEEGKKSRQLQIPILEAKSLLEKFRTQAFWDLCGDYSQAGLLDGGASSLKVRIGAREKSVHEYGDVAPPIFREIELAIDAAANTHQWRHGDPKTESIVEITYEDLPKPGKTTLMDAASRGDKVGVQAALAAGDMLTDVDTSGWTPLMYAAGSYYGSVVNQMIAAGAQVNARSKRGETALMASAVRGMVDEDLLEAGADVNAVNDVGMTALMLLVQRGNPDEITTLLKAGADARKKDAVGRTALDYLNAANCGRSIVKQKDPEWMTFGYSRCNVLGNEEYQKSKQLLINAHARATRVYIRQRVCRSRNSQFRVSRSMISSNQIS